MRKSQEDLVRLNDIKRNVAQGILEIKTMKATIKALKQERKAIKEKYKKVVLTC